MNENRFAYFAGLITGDFIRAWLLMLFLGAVHHDYFPQVPAIGYIQAFITIWIYDAVVSNPMVDAVRRGVEAAR